MPTLDVSELNTVLGVLGAFVVLYGTISVKIKNVWYLGEALPAFVMGIMLGPIASRFIDVKRWGSAAPGQQDAVTLGLCRVVIGVQLVMAGYQLPAKYPLKRWKEIFLCLIPIMTVMWLCTTGCIMATIPKISLMAALVIGSCVTCTDPVLSQAIAKGPFADQYVARELREIISAEAGANDGFGLLFLMLGTYLIRYANVPHAQNALEARAGDVGRLGGGTAKALGVWVVETILYFVLLSVVYGAVVGYGSCRALRFALRRKWVDQESYLLFPTALGLFIVGTCGAIGTDDLLACFAAGCALNWDGEYLAETEARHDEVNGSIDVLLNLGGFMYIGSIIPWNDFNQPEVTGITYGRLIGLGILVLLLRRIPALLMAYKLMPGVCKSWKDALFMGYFGPIGIGAVFYLEHTRHLFPELGDGDSEETHLIRALGPVIYWLVLFSIVIHGLSIPALNIFYKMAGVNSVVDPAGPVEMRPLSRTMSLPKNSSINSKRQSVMLYNRFSRSSLHQDRSWDLPYVERGNGEPPEAVTFRLRSMNN